MAASSRIGELRSNLQTQLEARAGLTGVTVTRYRPAPDDRDATEHIWFDQVDADMERAAPGSRFDTIDLTVMIEVRKPGGDEAATASAESRALALFAELEAQVYDDPTIDGAALTTNIIRYALSYDPEPGNQVCSLEAILRFETQLENA